MSNHNKRQAVVLLVSVLLSICTFGLPVSTLFVFNLSVLIVISALAVLSMVLFAVTTAKYLNIKTNKDKLNLKKMM